jgi:hypothetical protein
MRASFPVLKHAKLHVISSKSEIKLYAKFETFAHFLSHGCELSMYVYDI